MFPFDMMSGWASGWWSVPMIVGMAAFWVAIVILGFWVVRALTGSPTPTHHVHETPIDSLKRSYASGEIDKSDFEKKKRLLT